MGKCSQYSEYTIYYYYVVIIIIVINMVRYALISDGIMYEYFALLSTFRYTVCTLRAMYVLSELPIVIHYDKIFTFNSEFIFFNIGQHR